jgi:hypothetical protein
MLDAPSGPSAAAMKPSDPTMANASPGNEISVNSAASAARPGTRSSTASRPVRSISRQDCCTGRGARESSTRPRRRRRERVAETNSIDRDHTDCRALSAAISSSLEPPR